jgi:hypothetical protein
MNEMTGYQSGLGRLRGILAGKKESPSFREFLRWQQPVVERYQPIFSTANLPNLTAEDFRSFLLFRNNHHWKSINRQSGHMTAKMEKLRKALLILVDESQDIKKRLGLLLPKNGKPMVKGLGRAVITPILFVSHPDKYGVWNRPSEAGMKSAGLFPEFARGEAFAERYVKVNQVLLQLSRDLGIDLWTLDALWWEMIDLETVSSEDADSAAEVDETEGIAFVEQEGPRFGLEQHLHEFLRDNWPKTPLGREWDLYEEDGELVGYQYPCTGVGYADLVARHKEEPWWLVIELKRDQSSDTTIGQVLRYMGWVGAHLAKSDEKVKGLIISHKGDRKLHYALRPTTDIEFMTYEVDFRLKKANRTEE